MTSIPPKPTGHTSNAPSLLTEPTGTASPPAVRTAEATAPQMRGVAANPKDGLERAGPPSPSMPLSAVAPDYYDASADAAARKQYYRGIDPNLGPEQFFSSLSKLVRATHRTQLDYSTARRKHLYPRVDLRPNLKLECVYSGKVFEAEDVIKRDLRVDMALRFAGLVGPDVALPRLELVSSSTAMLERLKAQLELAKSAIHQGVDPKGVGATSSIAPLAIASAIAPPGIGKTPLSPAVRLVQMLGRLLYNAEHSTPQSWFDMRHPMRADLHGLFTCDPEANTMRGNLPYGEVSAGEAVESGPGGRASDAAFEPKNGKGAVARAVLYFLMRYPNEVQPHEMPKEVVDVLLRWSGADPPGLWEFHRNAEIERAQGNRNPLIDHPEWGSNIDFLLGLRAVRRKGS